MPLKCPESNGFTGELCHIFKKWLISFSHKLFQNIEEEGVLPSSLYKAYISFYGKHSGSCLKGKNTETSPDPAALLDKPQRNKNIRPHINTYRNIPSSLTQRAKKWKQHRCPWTDRWINKEWYIH